MYSHVGKCLNYQLSALICGTPLQLPKAVVADSPGSEIAAKYPRSNQAAAHCHFELSSEIYIGKYKTVEIFQTEWDLEEKRFGLSRFYLL